MCRAVTVWVQDGVEVKRQCHQAGEPLCGYHRKMAQGLLEPYIPQDTGSKTQIPLRVEAGDKKLWTR